MAPYRSKIETILFDLFGTLVSIDSGRIPRRRVDGAEYVMTIERLEELLAETEPAVSVADFWQALLEVSREMALEKRRDHRELPSRERFRRVLSRLNLRSPTDELACELSRRHMAGLAAAVVCRDDRAALLGRLSERYRLALVSNFDDGPTAHAILQRYELASRFGAIVISDDYGRRKPAPEIFWHACQQLGSSPETTVHVGDSYDDDVRGGVAAGLAGVLWVSDVPSERGEELSRIGDVSEVPARLESIG